jgi:hypothetical protein
VPPAVEVSFRNRINTAWMPRMAPPEALDRHKGAAAGTVFAYGLVGVL